MNNLISKLRKNSTYSQFLGNRTLVKIGVILLYFSVFLLYLCIASNGNFLTFKSTLEPNGYNAYLADAFLHGQTSLMIKPSPELLKLSDPYDSNTNGYLRLHDASLYNGKYYLYFSPLVALLVIVPFKLLTGYFISEALAMTILSYIGFCFLFATLRKIYNFFHLKINFFVHASSFLACVFVTYIPFLLHRAAIYEVCIAGAYAIFMIALYYSTDLIRTEKFSYKTVLFGLFLGLTILARPNQLFTCIILALSSIWLHCLKFDNKKGKFFLGLIYIGLPMLIIMIGMLYYNYHRYNSLFEFGLSYQLAGFNPKKTAIVSMSYIPIGVYNYIFQTPTVNLFFPFVHPETAKPLYWYLSLFKHIPHEQADQYLASIPYERDIMCGIAGLPIFYLLIFPILYIRRLYKNYGVSVLYPILFFVCAFISMICVSTMLGVNMRYPVDFLPMLLLSALIGYVMFLNTLNKKKFKFGSVLLFIFALLSSLISVALSIEGYGDGFRDGLKYSNPDVYNKLKGYITKLVPEPLIETNKIYLIKSNYGAVKMLNLSLPDGWSINKTAEIEIRVSKKDIYALSTTEHPTGSISFKVEPFIYSQLKTQNVKAHWGNNKAMTADVSYLTWINFPYELIDWHDEGDGSMTIKINFDFPNAVIPKDISDSQDSRLLALRFISFIVLS